MNNKTKLITHHGSTEQFDPEGIRPSSAEVLSAEGLTEVSSLITNKRGFTLIELMVVVVILGLLAAIVVPRFIGRVGPAKQKAASTQIELFGTALDSFRLDAGRYPTTSEGLQALITKPSDLEDWNGPYLKKQEIPLDPWGNPYHYESPGSHGDYDLYSYGADNAEGGDRENQDIVSWKGLK